MTKRLTRQKAIRAKCIDCCNGSRHEVRLCAVKNCPLWTYRLGYEVLSDGSKPPYKKGVNNIEKEQ